MNKTNNKSIDCKIQTNIFNLFLNYRFALYIKTCRHPLVVHAMLQSAHYHQTEVTLHF